MLVSSSLAKVRVASCSRFLLFFCSSFAPRFAPKTYRPQLGSVETKVCDLQRKRCGEQRRVDEVGVLEGLCDGGCVCVLVVVCVGGVSFGYSGCVWGGGGVGGVERRGRGEERRGKGKEQRRERAEGKDERKTHTQTLASPRTGSTTLG